MLKFTESMETKDKKKTVLPIVAYGDPVLKKAGEEVDLSDPLLDELIDNMFETMYNAYGVGLAAPQVGKSLRLFVVDGTPYAENDPENEDMQKLKGFRETFINPEIIEEDGEEWAFEEGCLSIPGIREEVMRPEYVRISYLNKEREPRELELDGLAARIVQHEYDHIEGILFTDHLRPLRKRLLKRKLSDISKGKISVDYRMKFPNKKH